jgi:hypothetical protein
MRVRPRSGMSDRLLSVAVIERHPFKEKEERLLLKSDSHLADALVESARKRLGRISCEIQARILPDSCHSLVDLFQPRDCIYKV